MTKTFLTLWMLLLLSSCSIIKRNIDKTNKNNTTKVDSTSSSHVETIAKQTEVNTSTTVVETNTTVMTPTVGATTTVSSVALDRGDTVITENNGVIIKTHKSGGKLTQSVFVPARSLNIPQRVTTVQSNTVSGTLNTTAVTNTHLKKETQVKETTQHRSKQTTPSFYNPLIIVGISFIFLVIIVLYFLYRKYFKN